jgi:hypothetical protein
MERHIEWTSPAPLWHGPFDPTTADGRRRFRQPVILRFDNDAFMDQFLGMLKQDPGSVASLVAQPETWRGPLASVTAVAPGFGLPGKLGRLRTTAQRILEERTRQIGPQPAPPPPALPLKLYQPAHQRFYLVSGCLVCRMPGLPDRALATNRAEKVTFVVRRLQIPANVDPSTFVPEQGKEFAFVAKGTGFEWEEVTGDRAQLWPGEDQQPLSPATYQDDNQHQRRLFAGLIPVGKREAYCGAKAAPNPLPQPPLPSWQDLSDPRQTLLRNDVIAPWKCLLNLATDTNFAVTSPPTGTSMPDAATFFNAARDQIAMLSWYVLLDFDKYLRDNVRVVWNALPGSGVGLNSPQTALYSTLINTKVTYADSSTRTLASALLDIRSFENALEINTKKYTSGDTGWPDFLFPLAAVFLDPAANPLQLGPAAIFPSGVNVDVLEQQVVAALDSPSGFQPPPRLAAQTALNASAAQGADYFHIRFVLERPNCGPLATPVVSEATVPFRLAAFFDPDAPARPIRIAMPIDTTPAGLRKFDKNTAFVMSDILCGQMRKMGSLSLGDLVLSVLPWPFHKSLDTDKGSACTAGMVCSMSIPIITICALILLMIIIKLFDIIFFWVPFFRICFPIPGFKAKEIS